MKRILSTALVLVFLNYIAGYYAIFGLLRNQANQQMMGRLNSDNYSERETMTFKFPFTLPYHKDWNSYERVDGSFELRGEYFKLVKQKLDHDTLYIVCIRDYGEKKISSLVADFIRWSNDFSANSKTIKLMGSFAKDYLPCLREYDFYNPVQLDLKGNCATLCFLPAPYISIPSPPPES